MSYLGDFALGSTVFTKFTTVDSSGVAATLASTATLEAYIDNSSTPSTAGITLSTDFNARTGLNHVRVITASTNGFASGNHVMVSVATGLIGSKSAVGYTVCEFSIEGRSALRPTTAGRTLDVSAGGEGGIDWANIGSPTTAQNLSATNIDTDQVVASVSGAVGSVTGNVGGNVTGSVGSVATGGIAAASFAAGAIDAAAIAANAIGAAEIADGAIDAATFAAGAITATVIATGAIDADALAADAVDEIWDEVVDGSVTARQSLRLANSAGGGILAGAATTSVTIRDLGDTKNRVAATVDANGNRSAVTLDLT